MTDQTQTTTEPVSDEVKRVAAALAVEWYSSDEGATQWLGFVSLARASIAATTPQPLAIGLDREAVARVIDPAAWDFYDRHKSNPIMGAEIAFETRPSLAKADAILALVAPAEGWQGIETAPKKVEFRCLLAHEFSVVTGYWDGDKWVNERSYHPHHGFPATHWMPLPAAPTGETGA